MLGAPHCWLSTSAMVVLQEQPPGWFRTEEIRGWKNLNYNHLSPAVILQIQQQTQTSIVWNPINKCKTRRTECASDTKDHRKMNLLEARFEASPPKLSFIVKFYEFRLFFFFPCADQHPGLISTYWH